MNIQILMLSVALSVSMGAKAANYYLDPAGSDTNPGTQAQPWQTIAKANNTLVAGDTVFLRAGTYTDQIRPVNNGTSDSARISYVAFGNGNVIIDNFGDQSSGSNYTVGGIALGGKSYVTVNGVNQYIRLNKSGCYNALANFTGANRTVINSVYLDGSNNTCGNMVFTAGYLYGTNIGSTQYNVLSNSYIRGISATANPRTREPKTILASQVMPITIYSMGIQSSLPRMLI